VIFLNGFSVIFLEFLQHSDNKPRTIRPRKDLFDHFDDEEFKKRFRLTKSTITKLLEQVGIYQRTAQRLKGSSFYQYLYILHYYELHQRAGVCLFTTSAINDVTNNAIGLGQGQWWIQALADLAGIGCDIFREIGLLP